MSRNDFAISACILARNEERRIEEALRSLQGWTDQIIVIDNQSEDGTVAVARRYTDCILSAPHVSEFDSLRNLAIDAATGGWLFYLDADERVPARLGAVLRGFVREKGAEFEALCIPFKHYFCGKWMQHSGWWPGYTRPQLLKKGCFRHNERLHSGVAVQGRTLFLPADDPDLAIAHYSFDNVHHYLEKLNRYTDGEAQGLYADGAAHSWQAQLAHFVRDWQDYYERGRADLDGMHGFALAFMSGFYRFLARAKLWDLRRQRGELLRPEPVPSSLGKILEFMARVAREGAEPWVSGSYPRIRTTGEAIPPEWVAPPQNVVSSGGEAECRGRSGITGCILARNEERRIEEALRSLQGWTDQIIVIDNESEDSTAAVARRYTDCILTAPQVPNFDSLRNLAIDAATGGWLFYLDADERVSPRLGAALRQLVREHGDEFDALCVPFRNYFYGHWMQSGVWWPAYKGPQLLKKGTFQFDGRIHSGVQVQGRLCHLRADDPTCAVDHYAYDDLHHYLNKLNCYTDAEAELLDEAGASHSWQAHLADLVRDWRIHYDDGGAYRDGMHGFVQSFLCAFYRFAARAKLWDRRQRRGEPGGEEAVPASLGEMLGFMIGVAREGAERWPGGGGTLDLSRDQERWAEIYHRVGLAETPNHYRAFTSMPFLSRLLETVQALSPPGGRVLETGVGFGYGSVWLSQHGVRAEGIDYSPAIVERANKVNELLGGQAAFRLGDFFDLPRCASGTYDVIFHQGVLEHFTDEQIRTILRAQVSLAHHVVFSVPSVHYPFEREFGNERLLSVEEWGSILEGFRVESLTYYGDPKLGAREQLLAVLQGAVPADTGGLAPGVAVAETVGEPGLPVPVAAGEAAERIPLLWRAPLFDGSGFADESRNFVLGLIEAGEAVSLAPERWGREAELEPEDRALLTERIVPADSPAELCVLHTLLPLQQRSPNARFNIARALFETDRLPAGAADALNTMDRVWVPSEFNRQTFVRGGVDPEKIAVVPEALDARRFADEGVKAWPLPGEEAYRFLSVFDWTLHKGWDVLLGAFAAEFGGDPDVGLVVKVWSSQRYTLGEMQAQADRHLRNSVGRGLAEFANIHLWQESLPVRDLPRLYRSAGAFVLPTRGEGWCRPLMEAMASGLPTIATAWSGLTEFHNSGVGYPLKYQLVPVSAPGAGEVPAYTGHYWAEPDLADLRRLMRRLVADPEGGRERGLAAREAIAGRYSRRAVADLLRKELARCREVAARPAQGPRPTDRAPAGTPMVRREPPPVRPAANLVVRDPVPPISFHSQLGRAVRVRWEGDQSLLSSLARVNREFCLGLLAAGDVELTLDERKDSWHTMTEGDDPRFGGLFAQRGARLSGPADVTVRQYFPPDWRRPSGSGGAGAANSS